MFWVSQLSPEAFFAVGVTSPLVSLMMGLGSSLAVGANSLIARELGEKAYEKTYNSILHAIVACIVLSIIFIIISFFFEDILAVMNVNNSVDLALAYITPMYQCSLIFLLSSLFTSTIQAEGNSKIPTRLLIFTNIFNLILDPFLIFVLGWGVAGAAYASILSTLITVIFFLYWYLSGRAKVVLDLKYFKPGILYDIFIVAVPNFLIIIIGCGSMMYFNKILIEQLGNLGILLLTTTVKIQNLITSPQKALEKSVVTISGQLYGAGMYDKLRDIFNYSTFIAASLALVCSIIFYFIRDYGFALYSVTGAETYVFYIAVACIFLFPCTQVSMIARTMLNGMGKSYHSLILAILTLIVEIGLTTVLVPILTSGVCVLVGISATEIFFSIIYYIIVRDMTKGKNKLENKIQEKKNAKS